MLILNTRYNSNTDYADFTDYIQHIKNNFTSDYANYADFQYLTSNKFTTDNVDYTDFRDSLTTLTTLIFSTT